MGWDTIFKSGAFFSIAILLLGCNSRILIRRSFEPEQIDRNYWKILTQLNSFTFTLYYHTDWPTTITAKYSGRYNRPDREQWDGYWEREDVTKVIRLRAWGDWQFAMEGTTWRKTPRGLESKIFDQIEQLFHDAHLEYLGLEKGRFRYRFKPHLPLLDLPEQKHMSGILEIDAKSNLPVRIYCLADDRSAEWDMRFERCNRAGKIKFPFVPAIRIVVTTLKGGVNYFRINEAKTIIRNRLKYLGIECQLKTMGIFPNSKFAVLMDRVFTQPALRMLFGVGRVELWKGEWSDGTGASGVTRPVGRDASKRVVLRTLLAGNQELNTELVPELPVAPPRLLVTISSKEKKGEGLPVLVLDGVVLGVGVWEERDRCSFGDIGGEETARIVAALARQKPLPLELRFDVLGN